jgi:hypothetical protein
VPVRDPPHDPEGIRVAASTLDVVVTEDAKMPKHDIEWGDAEQPAEGGVMPTEPAQPESDKRRRKDRARKSARGRRKTQSRRV